MTAARKLLAIDLGAESGRGLLGLFDGQRLRLELVHRFPNGPVPTLDTLHWDVLRLHGDILTALRLCAAKTGASLRIATPAGYEPLQRYHGLASAEARSSGAQITLGNDPITAVSRALSEPNASAPATVARSRRAWSSRASSPPGTGLCAPVRADTEPTIAAYQPSTVAGSASPRPTQPCSRPTTPSSKTIR